jgi:hypothetical protein
LLLFKVLQKDIFKVLVLSVEVHYLGHPTHWFRLSGRGHECLSLMIAYDVIVQWVIVREDQSTTSRVGYKNKLMKYLTDDHQVLIPWLVASWVPLRGHCNIPNVNHVICTLIINVNL